MKLYLIRHGQTAWNAQSRVMGRSETPLDAIGEKQVSQMAKSLKDFTIEKIFSSPQLRAQQTAQALAMVKNIPVHRDERLAEIDFPRWQGKTIEEIRDDEVYRSRRKDILSFLHPEVESYQSLIDRISAFCVDMEKAERDIAVVTHADVVKGFMIHLLQVPSETFFQFKIQNASCTVLNKENERWILELMNFSSTPLQGLNI